MACEPSPRGRVRRSDRIGCAGVILEPRSARVPPRRAPGRDVRATRRASASARPRPTRSTRDRTTRPGASTLATPQSTATGTPASALACKTPAGTFPWSDPASKAPSPVTTTDAAASRSWNPTASITTSTPGRSRAPANASSPNPSPPAAPAPGSRDRSTPRSRAATAARCASARSSTITSSGDAPFWGPNTTLAPAGPHSGLSTSVTPITSTVRTTSRTGPASIRSSATSEPPPLRDRLARRVEEAPAERRRHPDPAVVGRRPPETDQEPAGAGRHRRGHELPGSSRGRPRRVATVRRHELEPRGPRHLDHAGLTTQPERGVDRIAERPGDPHDHAPRPAVLGRREHVERALPAVGQRDAHR